MLKKTVTYTDYNGETRTEVLHFNLSKAEVIELELSAEGGLERRIRSITESGDNKQMFEVFKNLIVMAYGERSADGRRFIKNDQIRKEFLESEAYSELFYELVTDSNAAADFFNGIIPSLSKDEPAKQ